MFHFLPHKSYIYQTSKELHVHFHDIQHPWNCSGNSYIDQQCHYSITKVDNAYHHEQELNVFLDSKLYLAERWPECSYNHSDGTGSVLTSIK